MSDSRSKPVRAETGNTGSVHESGGAVGNRPNSGHDKEPVGRLRGEELVERAARAMHSEGVAIFLENNPRSSVPDWDGDDQDARDALARMARAAIEAVGIEQLLNENERLTKALEVARKQVVEITCDATQKLREIGYECDPADRTYLPALDRIDAALSGEA